MKIISICSTKGGVGKTNIAFGLGQVLTDKGKKVLLIDADSNTNLTYHCLPFVDEQDLWDRNIYHFFTNEQSIHSLVHEGICCDIIPATIEFAKINDDVVQIDQGKIKRLNNVIRKTDYDYVIIDTTPHLGKDLYSTLSISDLVVHPIGAHRWTQTPFELIEMVLDEIGAFTKRPEVVCVPSIITPKQHEELQLYKSLPVTDTAIFKSAEVVNIQQKSKTLRPTGKTYNQFVELVKEVG